VFFAATYAPKYFDTNHIKEKNDTEIIKPTSKKIWQNAKKSFFCIRL